MKELVFMAKRAASTPDGFINGFIKGVIGSAATIVILTFLTGFAG